MRAIKHLVLWRDQAYLLTPVVRPLGQIRIGLVARVPRQPRAHVEKQPVGDGVLVIVATVGGDHLPPHTAAAIIGIPPRGLSIEDGLGQGEPLRLIRGGVGEGSFGGRDDGEGPESLIVVAERELLRGGFVVVVRADLIEQSGCHEVVELVISSVMPVVDPSLQRRHMSTPYFPTKRRIQREERRDKKIRFKYPHGSASLPPVVALVVLTIGGLNETELSGDEPRLFVGVQCSEFQGDSCGGALDRIFCLSRQGQRCGRRAEKGGARSNIPKLVTSTSMASPEPENSEVDSREVETSAPASDGSLMADVFVVC